MPVVFTGGPSGNRRDYLAPVPDSGSPQPVQKTETSGPIPSTVHMDGGSSGNREEFLPSLPTGGGNGTGTDIEDPNA